MRYKNGSIFEQHGYLYVRFGRNGKAIRLGEKRNLKTKADIEKIVAPLRIEANEPPKTAQKLMSDVIGKYIRERIPRRNSTSTEYKSWINNHILPKWGDTTLAEFGHPPIVIEDWLKSLDLVTTSKREVKGIILQLVKAAQVWGWLRVAPDLSSIKLPKQKGEKRKKARILPPAEFKLLVADLGEPKKTMCYILYFHGLRISELLGLKWQDVNWLEKKLYIRQAVVAQVEDDTKTPESEAVHPLQDYEIDMLQVWRQQSEFTGATQYIFASPQQAGDKPWSYTWFKEDVLWATCDKIGIPRITTHSFRHTFRTLLTANGATPEQVMYLMRHTKIDMSFKYGESVAEQIREAHRKLVAQVLGVTDVSRL